jgi:hypothetical protein
MAAAAILIEIGNSNNSKVKRAIAAKFGTHVRNNILCEQEV